ncbi:MAG: hypothetical protein KC506_00805 [Nanoarchaeota archaeon]|nr:hypothetical protein [Nanoarchaeota archaeon]
MISERVKTNRRIVQDHRQWVSDRDWTNEAKINTELRIQYPNQWVAVHNKEVVANSQNQEDLYTGRVHPNREIYYTTHLKPLSREL